MSIRTFKWFAGTISVLVLVIGGCASTGNKVDQSRVDRIQKGVTTRAEVETEIGSPDSVAMMPDGGRMLMYNYFEAKSQARNFIPYLNLLGSGSDTRRQTLQVMVGPDGVVRDYEMTDRTGQSNYNALGYTSSYREHATPEGAK